MGFGRGRAMLGMPFGPGAAHIVKLGTIGIEERLEQAQDVCKFRAQSRCRPAVYLSCLSRRRHVTLLSAVSPPLFPGSPCLPFGRSKMRPGSAAIFGWNSLKTGAYLHDGSPPF